MERRPCPVSSLTILTDDDAQVWGRRSRSPARATAGSSSIMYDLIVESQSDYLSRR